MTIAYDLLARFPGFHLDPAAEASAPDAIHVEDAGLIFRGDYVRDGPDLVVTGSGQRLVVHDYFTAAHRPKLVAPNGASLSDAVIEALARPAHGVQVAQAGAAPASDASDAIGRVQTVTGTASVVRNGVTVAAHAGDLIYKGDVLQTDRGAALSVSFLDGTVFSLAASARMVMSEMVYQAGGSNNRSLFNLVQGSISFVAGQVAKTGDMKVGTPVATMGIRGTAVKAAIDADDGTSRLSVMSEPPSQEHPGGHTGRFDVYDRDNPDTVLTTVSDPDTVVVVHPKGTAETRIEQVPKTQAEIAGEHDLVQTLYHTQAEAPRLPIYTGPSTGGGTSSGTAPNLILNDQTPATPPPAGSGGQAPGQTSPGDGTPGGAQGPSRPADPPSPTDDAPPRVDLTPAPLQTPIQASASAPVPSEPAVEAPPAQTTLTLTPEPAVPVPARAVVAQPAAATAQPATEAQPAPAAATAQAPAILALSLASAAVIQGGVLTVAEAAHGVLAADAAGVSVVAAHAGSGPETVLTGGEATLTGQYGTLTLHADGTYVYHADNATALAQDQAATDAFVFSARSADGATGAATLVVEVTGTNDLPELSRAPGLAITAAGSPDGTAVIDRASGHVGFGDPDLTDSHTAAVAGAPTLALSSGAPVPAGLAAALTGALTASADDAAHRVDYAFAAADHSFAFLAAGERLDIGYDLTVSDGHGGVAHTPVTVTVTGTNDAPVSGGDHAIGAVLGQGTVVRTADLGASDPDGSPSQLTYTITSNPHGHFTLGSATVTRFTQAQVDAGEVVYNLDGGASGHEVVAFTLSDGAGGSVAGSLDVAVTSSNAPPTITTGAAAVTLTASPIRGNTTPQSQAGRDDLTAGNGLVDGLGGPAGFGEQVLDRGDDNSSARIDLTGVFGTQGINFFGQTYSGLYVNNNGNLTFAGPSSNFTPSQITSGTAAIIAPFFADVDTRSGAVTPTPGGNSTGSNRVYVDQDVADGVLTVTWDDVGAFSYNTTHLDAFQVQLISLGGGNFDIVYRYESVGWTTTGGPQAVAGYAAGDGTHFYELPQSGNAAQLQTLPTTVGNTGIPGVYVFQASGGTVTADTALTAAGTIGFTDADAGDRHTASASLHLDPTTSSGAAIPADTAAALRTALSAHVTQDGNASGGSAGTVTWSFALANGAAAFLHAGETLSATYDIGVSDGTASSAPTSVTVTIAGVNDAPSVDYHALAVVADQSVTLRTADLGASDPDNTAGQLTYTITDDPHGSFSLRSVQNGASQLSPVTSFTQAQVDAGSVVYRHDATAPAGGSETVSFVLTDGAGGSTGGTLAVAVTPAPDHQLVAPGGVQAAVATPGVTDLTQRQLEAIVAAAIAEWAGAGATAAQIALLTASTYLVTDLPGTALGQESAGHVSIDTSAAGYGWYVDPTPGEHSEFGHPADAAATDLFTDPAQAAAGHVDLLSVVTHEMGHILGLPDSFAQGDSHDLMYLNLALGERRLPSPADVAAATTTAAAATSGGGHAAARPGAADTGRSSPQASATASGQAADAPATGDHAGSATPGAGGTEHAASAAPDPDRAGSTPAPASSASGDHPPTAPATAEAGPDRPTAAAEPHHVATATAPVAEPPASVPEHPGTAATTAGTGPEPPAPAAGAVAPTEAERSPAGQGSAGTGSAEHPAAAHEAGAHGAVASTAGEPASGSGASTQAGGAGAEHGGVEHAATGQAAAGQSATATSTATPSPGHAETGTQGGTDPGHAIQGTPAAPAQGSGTQAAVSPASDPQPTDPHDGFVFSQTASTGSTGSGPAANSYVPSHDPAGSTVQPDPAAQAIQTHYEAATLHTADPMPAAEHDPVAQVAALQLHH